MSESQASLRGDLRGFRRYPEYKDSGVEWLGHIPAHWKITRTKFVARLRSGHTPSRQHPEYWLDCTIPWFGLADVWQIREGRVEYVTETSEKISELGLANSAARLLPRGTVIVSRTASVGFSAILGVDAATTQDFVNWVCGPELRPEYLLYVFRSMTHEFRRLTMGSTHQTIYMPDVGRFMTPLPPLAEQNKIVAFIRKRTAHLDDLINRKERLLALLQEQRAALITRAVTKGIDAGARLKQTDAVWLGAVPEHWTVGALKTAIVFQRGHDLPADERETGDIPVVSSSGICGTHVRAAAKGPGIVTGRYGTIGDFHLVETDYWPLNTALYSVDLRDNDLRFLRYMLKHLSPIFLVEALKSAVPGIDRNDIHQILAAIPPVTEQRRIAEFLDSRTAHIASLIATVEGAIERLTELRAATIADAVAGTIDVREEIA